MSTSENETTTIGNFCSDELVIDPNESVSQVTSVAKSGESWCRPFIIEVTINDQASSAPSERVFSGGKIIPQI